MIEVCRFVDNPLFMTNKHAAVYAYHVSRCDCISTHPRGGLQINVVVGCERKENVGGECGVGGVGQKQGVGSLVTVHYLCSRVWHFVLGM
jgi:hypothetical protein